jgi:anti-sigma B factor antagonist
MAPHEIDHVPPGPELSVRSQGGYTIVAISGEIDIASVPVLRERLIGLPQPQASRIIIDLSRVTFCDASGLAVLVGASRRAGLLGGVLRLAAPAPMMATVLRLTGLHSRFEIFGSVSQAIGAVTHPGRGEADMSKPAACWPDQHAAVGQLQVTAAAGGHGGVR